MWSHLDEVTIGFKVLKGQFSLMCGYCVAAFYGTFISKIAPGLCVGGIVC